MIDYHVHTRLCNHAVGTVREYVEKGVEKEISEICFLDHLTLTEFSPSSSMTPGEVPFYFQTIQELKQEFSDQIKIKVGLEVDFNPDEISQIEDIIATYSFDVIGSSVHFLKFNSEIINIASRKSAKKLEQLDFDKLCETYLQQMDKMLDYKYFNTVCHLDVIKKFGGEIKSDFSIYFDEILAKISSNDIVVEINTSGYKHPINELYPSPGLISDCRKADINITVGSDAHKPENVGQHYEKAMSIIKDVGYKCITGFSKMEKKQIPLNILN